MTSWATTRCWPLSMTGPVPWLHVCQHRLPAVCRLRARDFWSWWKTYVPPFSQHMPVLQGLGHVWPWKGMPGFFSVISLSWWQLNWNKILNWNKFVIQHGTCLRQLPFRQHGVLPKNPLRNARQESWAKAEVEVIIGRSRPAHLDVKPPPLNLATVSPKLRITSCRWKNA